MSANNLGSDYTPEELAFMQAMDQYKRNSRRPFPTWREVLKVAHSLGYRKDAKPIMKEPMYIVESDVFQVF